MTFSSRNQYSSVYILCYSNRSGCNVIRMMNPVWFDATGLRLGLFGLPLTCHWTFEASPTRSNCVGDSGIAVRNTVVKLKISIFRSYGNASIFNFASEPYT